MIKKKDKYNRNLELSLIVTLLLLIFVFYFFPRFNSAPDQIPQYKVPAIEVLYIPSTSQEIVNQPKPQRPFIPVESDEIDMLDNVEIEQIIQGDSSGYAEISGPVDYKELPFTPRQLYDIMPEKIDEDVSGTIILSLRIGIDGKVKEYKVVKNTTNSKSHLNNVIKAAQQSKWESAVLNNQKVEYWINKTYRFN